jgi:hypothetical protein
MAGRGLSYQQGPALAAPLRLFLAAPLFLMLAAAAGIVLAPGWLSGRWSPAALALTHLVTLGYLGSVMQGALLQMLPVVLGSPLPRADGLSRLGLAGLGLGAPLLAAGLLFGEPRWLVAALVALALAWLPFLAALAVALARALTGGDMDWPLRLAGIALIVTVATGLALAGGLAGLWPLPELAGTVDLHAGWGLFGWVLVLVVGVAYQVVPMLQLTPAYPRPVTRLLAWLLPAGLAAFTLATLLEQAAWLGRGSLIASAGGALVFALATLQLLRRRRRRLADVTLDFWRLGLASLVLAALLYGALGALPGTHRTPAELSLALLFLLGFAASVVNGMLYKIVPFLAWFHLQSQTGARAGTIPNMREMIPEPAMRGHFRLHLAAVCLLVPAPFLPPWAATPGLLALAAGAHRLWLNLLLARRTFLRHGGRLQ